MIPKRSEKGVTELSQGQLVEQRHSAIQKNLVQPWQQVFYNHLQKKKKRLKK